MQGRVVLLFTRVAQLSTARDGQNVVRSTGETANSSLVVRVILFLQLFLHLAETEHTFKNPYDV